jgi:peptide/nickel transport system substrate-binding protein
MMFSAFPSYTLGQPKIDTIEIRIISDPNLMVANLIAGNVDLALGRTVSLEQAVEVAGRWPGGRMERPLNGLILIYPQLLNPTPAIVADTRFRRALLNAIDRQALVDVLQYGQTSIGHSFEPPDQPEYSAIENQIVRFDYDERKARESLASLGYAPGADGSLRDGTGQPLRLELRSSNVDINQKSMYSVADYWGRVGIGVDTTTIPPERIRDQEYVATFPALNMFRGTSPGASWVRNWHGSRASLPENNFQVSGNNSRYRNPDLDALIDRYFATIPTPDRNGVLGQIVHHVTDQALMLGLFFNTDPVMIGSRLGPEVGITTWNVERWTVVG